MWLNVNLVLLLFVSGCFTQTSAEANREKTCISDDILRMIAENGRHCCIINQDKQETTKRNPVFMAFLKPNPTYSGNSKFLFDDVTVNVGNNYSPKTGEFIAPMKGIYQMSCAIFSSSTGKVHFQLNKNDQLYAYGFVSGGKHATSNSHNWVIHLEKRDRVYIRHRGSSSEGVIGNRCSHFSGFLLQK